MSDASGDRPSRTGLREVAAALAIGVRSSARHPILAAGFLVATVVQGALQGLLVWTLRSVLLRFSEAGVTTAAVVASALLVLGLWVLRAALVGAAEVLSANLAHRVEVRSMREVIAKLLTLSVRFFDRSSQGDLIMASYFDMKGVRTVTLDVGAIVLHVSRLIGLVVVAWVLSPSLAIIGLITVPLGAVPAYWIGRHLTAAARDERSAMYTLYDSFIQVTSGIRMIRVNRGETNLLSRTDAMARDLFRHVMRQARSRTLAKFLLEAASGFGLVAVLVVGGGDVAAGRLEWQTLLSLLVAVMAVYGPMVGLMQVYTTIRGVIPNLERVERIMTAVPEIADVPSPRSLPAAPRVIELENVSFQYDGRLVLDGVSARFEEGETIGIVGPSGAGKSTLVALMLRFYDPTSGRIALDGVDLREIRHADLMERCAIVMQEPFLLSDTVATNIRIGRPSATMAEVMDAARAARIHDDIEQMELGYETLLGRGGDARGISVGQKQRLCIAAALVKNAPLLFLDEATSNLDSVSERLVQDAIERLMAGRTTFVIAHRLSTLRNVDRILVLQHGRVVGLAPHADLLETCDVYQQLWRHQQPADETTADAEAQQLHHTAEVRVG